MAGERIDPTAQTAPAPHYLDEPPTYYRSRVLIYDDSGRISAQFHRGWLYLAGCIGGFGFLAACVTMAIFMSVLLRQNEVMQAWMQNIMINNAKILERLNK